MKKYAAIVALAAVVSGCSSPQFSRIDRDRELYESWPVETRQAVLDGKAEPGMTPDMVKMALGKPTEIVEGSSGPGEEIWIYRKGGDVDPGGMYPYPYPSGYPGGMGGTVLGGPGIGVSTGPGGTSIGTSMNTGIGIGIGSSGGIGISGPTIGVGSGTGVMGPMPMPMPGPSVVDREVVFRNGVVYRADNPTSK